MNKIRAKIRVSVRLRPETVVLLRAQARGVSPRQRPSTYLAGLIEQTAHRRRAKK